MPLAEQFDPPAVEFTDEPLPPTAVVTTTFLANACMKIVSQGPETTTITMTIPNPERS